MKVLAIYAVNEHINQLMVDAQQARMARDVNRGPSLLRRVAGAARAAFVRVTPQVTGAAA
jgi:N-formylglutamate amidohydrolase